MAPISWTTKLASSSVVSVRFGSVSVSSICYIGPVRFMFGSGSCGYLRFLVDFGSVRFAVWNILHWYWPFSRRRKSKYILLPARGLLLPARGLLLPARGFMSSGFQRAERAEPGNRKTKTSWNCQCMQFILKKPICAFFHWTQNAITTFPISLLEEGRTVPVPPVRFCTRFQRFTVC